MNTKERGDVPEGASQGEGLLQLTPVAVKPQQRQPEGTGHPQGWRGDGDDDMVEMVRVMGMMM